MMEEIICYAVLYLVEALIAWLYFEYLFERKYNVYVTILAFIAAYFLCYLLFNLNVTWVNTASICTANFILAFFCYNCRAKSALLHAAFLSFIMTISEILVGLLLGILGCSFTANISEMKNLLTMMLLSKILYLLLMMLSARLFKPHKEIEDEPKLMLVFCIIPLFSMIISVIVTYISVNTELNRSSEMLIKIIFLTLLTVNLLFFIIYNYIQRTNQQNTRLQISLKKDEADTAFYKALYEQAENQRILIHDIKKHLNIIGNLADEAGNPEIKKYIADIVGLSELNQKKKFSDNPILNIILQQYSQKCAQSEIAFMCDVRADTLKFMNSASITAVFENLLSNSYESALKTTKKYIDVSVIKYEESQSVVINVVNSCDEEPEKNLKGDYKTSKKSSGTHGYGIKSVIRVVNKYNGTNRFYYDALEKQFHAVVQFPCDARK